MAWACIRYYVLIYLDFYYLLLDFNAADNTNKSGMEGVRAKYNTSIFLKELDLYN